eukprot:Hpha_TRINITY_DN34730_c0_g1::TRINITY_DN34730_c0_g1_i1::g.178017::m.178017
MSKAGGALRCTRVALRAQGSGGMFNPYRYVDYPKVDNSIMDAVSPRQAFQRYMKSDRQTFTNHMKYGYDERRKNITGYGFHNGHGHLWPKKLMKPRGGRWGWNEEPKEEGYASYRSHMEKRYETGELEQQTGEMWPNHIMQMWYGKRVEQKRMLTWADQRTIRRHHPFVHSWNPAIPGPHFYSELLEHAFKPAMEEEAKHLAESYGGLDQFILQNDPMFLQAFELERIRNYLLVRRMEMEKNYVLEEQAQSLAKHLFAQLKKRKKLTSARGAPEQSLPEPAGSPRAQAAAQ